MSISNEYKKDHNFIKDESFKSSTFGAFETFVCSKCGTVYVCRNDFECYLTKERDGIIDKTSSDYRFNLKCEELMIMDIIE